MKTSEALQRAADAAKMAEAHGLEVWEVARVNDGIDTRVFYGMAQYLVALGDCRDDLEYALGVCEKQPVWPESVLYWKNGGEVLQPMPLQDEVCFSDCTWTKPVLCCDKCGQKLPEKKYLQWPENAKVAQAAGLRFKDYGNRGVDEKPYGFWWGASEYYLFPRQPENWREIVKGLMDKVEFEGCFDGIWETTNAHNLTFLEISEIRLKGMTA